VPFPVEFHPEARTDFYVAVDWYEGERLGLGMAFSTGVQLALTRAAAIPLAGSPVGTELRRVFVPHFPYSVLYAVETTRLWVVAVAHFRRRPGYWRDRLTG
jgi:hypothetical protein